MSDDEVVAAAIRGDTWALEALYRTYAPQVLGYLRGHRVPDPEDATGEVFVSVVRNLPTFVGEEAEFRSWLFTIAHRRAIDSFRRRGRRREDPSDPAGLGKDLESGADIAEQVSTRLALGPLIAAVDSLTCDQRAVVLLRVIADVSVAETAAILGKEVGAVKTLQRRALAALRRTVSIEAVS
jgi:RNA polymerase sigma-70 factor (ECF subfamily)